MDDPLNKPAKTPVPWDVKVDAILASIRRRSLIYCAAGLGIFLPGAAAILALVPKDLASMCVFIFFDAIVIASFCLIVYPNFAGAFRVGLAANREMLGKMEQMTEDNPTVKKIEDAAMGAAADMKAVRVAIEKRTQPLPVRHRSNGEESPAEEVLDGSPQL